VGLHTELTGGTVTPCKVCAYLGSLDPMLAEEWQQELALPVSEVGNTAVVTALKRRSVIVTEASVRRHRRSHV
jgi:hypothetical protein